MYDVAIIGAGPAGATLARLIGDRYRVLLVDRRRSVSAADKAIANKCCGGLLAPDAQKMLSKKKSKISFHIQPTAAKGYHALRS